MGREQFTVGVQTTAPNESQARTTVVANSQDIQTSSVTASVDSNEVAIQISGTAGDDIKVEVSPDNGSTWFTIDESPFNIQSDGYRTAQVNYSTTMYRFTNTTSTNATTVVITER